MSHHKTSTAWGYGVEGLPTGFATCTYTPPVMTSEGEIVEPAFAEVDGNHRCDCGTPARDFIFTEDTFTCPDCTAEYEMHYGLVGEAALENACRAIRASVGVRRES